MSRIHIDKVSKAFGDAVVLRDFTQTFEDGGLVTLLGPSGCGKTTMLRMLAGFEKPTTGEIRIGDAVVSSDKVFVPPERRDIGMVFQSYAVWPHMTVFENVAYPLRIKRMPKAKIREAVDEVLAIVHLSQYRDRVPSQLSGGQQQRVALARALVARPKLLLLDEPLSNLDAKLRDSMRYEIKEIQRKLGITVVFVTHDQIEAMTMSDRIVVINHGVVQQVGTPVDIYRSPANQFVADFVGKINLVKGTSEGGAIRLEGGQSLAYDGPFKGAVVVGIRPENVRFGDGGGLKGHIQSRYYLGDVNDCMVDIGGPVIRIISEPATFDTHKEGDRVELKVGEFNVFPDDGNDDFRRIRT